MIAVKTLEKYIARCDEVSSSKEAMVLIKEIVGVFSSEFSGLKTNLETYGPGILAGLPIDYLGDIRILKARLQKELDALEEDVHIPKSKKIFISHATHDKEYVLAVVELLESIGLDERQIICSSIPPYSIPLGKNVYDWLVNEIQHSDLHMIFALSKTYYTRPVCLNEMGAAWAMKHKWTAILLPGFGYNEIEGCINPTQISIKLDDKDESNLNHRLGELKDLFIEEFELEPIHPSLWERRRDDFKKKIKSIIIEEPTDEFQLKQPAIGISQDYTLEKNESILLIYAAEDPSGYIIMSRTLGRIAPSITTCGYEFVTQDTAREGARWEAVLERLERDNLIKVVDSERHFLQVTNKGYILADQEKKKLGIDCNRTPEEYL